MTLTAIDVCAGAGGLSLGLQRAGFSVLGVERDSDATETHRRWVGPCELADITAWHPAGRVDAVTGGVSCQSFSMAGDRRGTEDERGRLYLDLVRVAVEADARAVLLENVRGLVSWRNKVTGWTALGTIREAMRAAGYHSTWTLLNAADYGVPQRRVRLFVVGFRNAADLRAFHWPAPSHDAPLFGLPAHVTVRQALKLGAGRYAHGRPDGVTTWQGMRSLDVDAVAAKSAPEKLSRIDAPAPCILANGHDETRDPSRPSRRPLAELQHEASASGLLDRPAHTVSSGGAETGGAEPFPNANYRAALSVATGGVRFTVEQLAALQSWPVEYTFHGTTQKSHHVQVGNMVPPPLAEAVGRSLAAVLSR